MRFSSDNFLRMDSRYVYTIKEFRPIYRVKITTEKVVKCCLWLYTTRAHRIYHMIKVVSRFMFVCGTKIQS